MPDYITLPAQPGFFVVRTRLHANGKRVLADEPIIAWRVGVDDTVAAVWPITPSGSLPDRYAIRYPDGRTAVGKVVFWENSEAEVKEALTAKEGTKISADKVFVRSGGSVKLKTVGS